MEQPPIEVVATATVKSLVNSYLLARAYAQTMREKVNEIYKVILTECPIYSDREGEQILDPDRLYLCSDMTLVQDAWDTADHRERKAGLKPDDMSDEKCPALVAEYDLVKVEWALIEATGEPMGITNNDLLCAGGSEMRQEFIDLVVGFIVNQSDFRHPLSTLGD